MDFPDSGEPPNDGTTSYIYGNDKEGFTKVTYGTSTGTSYEYIPSGYPIQRDSKGRFIFDNSRSLDPMRPLGVEEDD